MVAVIGGIVWAFRLVAFPLPVGQHVQVYSVIEQLGEILYLV